jgi:hypothetical protein
MREFKNKLNRPRGCLSRLVGRLRFTRDVCGKDRLEPVSGAAAANPRVGRSHRASENGGKACSSKCKAIVPGHAWMLPRKIKHAMRKNSLRKNTQCVSLSRQPTPPKMKLAPLYLLVALFLAPLSHAGEVVTVERGVPVYNVGPVMLLEKSGLSKVKQLEKIQTWLVEVDESITKHGANMAAEVFLGVLSREIKRLEKPPVKERKGKPKGEAILLPNGELSQPSVGITREEQLENRGYNPYGSK